LNKRLNYVERGQTFEFQVLHWKRNPFLEIASEVSVVCVVAEETNQLYLFPTFRQDSSVVSN